MEKKIIMATVSEQEKWLAIIRDTFNAVNTARKCAHQIEDTLFPVKVWLLELQKRIEESMAEQPSPVPEELRQVVVVPGPHPDLDKLLVHGFTPSAYLRRKGDDEHIFFLEYYTDNGGLILRDIDTKDEYQATWSEFAAVADQWETVPEAEVYPDDEEEATSNE